jgi:hypothetical protein
MDPSPFGSAFAGGGRGGRGDDGMPIADQSRREVTNLSKTELEFVC